MDFLNKGAKFAKSKRPGMYEIILSFITALTLTYFALPSIIRIATLKKLTDEPGERRAHHVSTPSLGGVGIFAGLIFSIVLWAPFEAFSELQYILCAFIIIFLVGVKDDIDPIPANKKLVAQILAASILIFKSNIMITDLHGFLGFYKIHPAASIVISLFTIIVIINAFNLIDGINGLSGSIGTLICVVLGTWFYLVEQTELAIISAATAGAILAFLRYNITPAKIFMGDTGSLLLGLVGSILAIKFMEVNATLEEGVFWKTNSAPAVVFGILIVPLFDTLRVFTMRILKGRSPFSPDRNHIHHLLLDSGLNHTNASLTLVFVNMGFIVFVHFFQDIGTFNLLLAVMLIAGISTAILYLSVRRKRKRQSQYFA